MRSFDPPRSSAADRKPADRPRRAVTGASAARTPFHWSGGAGPRREDPAPAAPRLRAAGGLPERLQTVMEAMSGFSLADVVVHRNSAEPARLGAAAFTKGSQIHLAPGQERHLPHEAWHVVQQAQGRVKPTLQMKSGVPINDDAGLEREADTMGKAAMELPERPGAAGREAARDQAGLPPPSAPGRLRVPGPAPGRFIMQLFRMTGNAAAALRDLPKPQEPVTATLPKNTRFKLKVGDILGLHGNDPNQWIQIEVTTGPQMGAVGWLQNKDVEAADQPETQKVEASVAKDLFKELAKAKFTASDGTEYNIPFSYPIDGCWGRAHRMSELLTAKGYASEKSFAVAGRGMTHPLRVKSSKAGDAAQGQAPQVTWGYHVAPVITYDDDSKNVIDPSIFDAPVPLTTWVGSMGSIQDFKLRTLSEIKQQVTTNTLTPEYRYYTAPRTQYFPTEQGGKEGEGDAEWKKTGPGALGRDRLAAYAKVNEPVHILASEIRTAIANGGDAARSYELLGKASDSARTQFFAQFPNLAKVPAQHLEKQIRDIIAGQGTQDQKYALLSALLAKAVPGTIHFIKAHVPKVITDMNAAVGLINSIELWLDWK